MIRVMIIEDQAMLRDSLARVIDEQDDMQVVGTLADASRAPAAVEEASPTVMLVDVCTEHNANGIDAARRIHGEHPEIKIVIMTGMPDVRFVEDARTAGCDSFVYKNVGTGELLSVLRSTSAGYSTFPLKSRGTLPGNAALTPTELDILRLVCETKDRTQIAHELYLSEGTVKRHISDILQKTGYDNILRLAVYAVANGLIVPTEPNGSQDETIR